MPVNVFESSVQYLIAIIMKGFLTKNGDFRQIKWFKTSKWSLLEHLKPETRNSFQHNFFSPIPIENFSSFHRVKLLSKF